MARLLFLISIVTVWCFDSLQAQTISSFSPIAGNVGAPVRVTGTNLNSAVSVSINGSPCIILNKTSTELQFLILPGATSGAITIVGSSLVTSSGVFTVTNVSVNPFQQSNKLVNTINAGSNSGQGNSLALSADGNKLVAGMPGYSTTGATVTYKRTGTLWAQQGGVLVGSGSTLYSSQGRTIALSADGKTLAVGGFNGNGNSGHDSADIGAVWIFTDSNGYWVQQGSKLIGSSAAIPSSSVNYYSVALSVDGYTLALGRSNDNKNIGATWIFTRNSGQWSEQAKLVGSNPSGKSMQGCAVALSADGNRLVTVGWDSATFSGDIWTFTRSGSMWVQDGPKFVSNQPFCYSVALSADGNMLAAGGIFDNYNLGATWVFSRSAGSWVQQAKLVGTGASGNKVFQGVSVALSADGNTLVSGGYYDDTQNGATWLFSRSGTNWTQVGEKITASDASPKAWQGTCVSLSSDGLTLAVGGANDSYFSGAAWVYSSKSSVQLAVNGAAASSAIHFWPNPATQQITIDGGPISGNLLVLDNTGRKVFQSLYKRGQPVNISILPGGVYLLRINSNQQAIPFIK